MNNMVHIYSNIENILRAMEARAQTDLPECKSRLEVHTTSCLSRHAHTVKR